VEEGVDEEGQEEGEEKDLLPGSVAIHLPLEVPVAQVRRRPKGASHRATGKG
jgi:hypothetical protein